MTKKLLYIDVDDTILDFTGGEKIAIKQTLADFSLPTTDKVISIYQEANEQMWKAFERGEISKPDLVIKRFSILLEKIDVSGIAPEQLNEVYFSHLKNQANYREGASEFLDKVSPYYRIILVTNGTTLIQESRLEISGLKNRVEGIFISEQMGSKKPERRYFEMIEDKIPAFDHSKIILVGDSLTSDILGGANYNVKTIWYNPNHKPQDKDIHPDITVYNYDELFNELYAFYLKN